MWTSLSEGVGVGHVWGGMEHCMRAWSMEDGEGRERAALGGWVRTPEN